MNSFNDKRRQALMALALSPIASIAKAASSSGSDWPGRLTRIIVPYTAGASSDIVARRLAVSLTQSLGQSFIVENRVGANGIIGASAMLQQTPDGSVFLSSDSSVAMVPATVKNVPYNSHSDMVAVAIYFFSPFGLIVRADSPFKTLQDFLNQARKAPDMIKYGSGGLGSSTHLVMEEFAQIMDVKLFHVPYKGGGQAVNALLGGQTDVQLASLTTSVPLLTSGRLRMLAVSGDHRPPLLPNVPTFSEAGAPKFSFMNWQGVLARRDTPAPIIQKFGDHIAKAMRSQEMQKFAEQNGSVNDYMIGEKAQAMFTAQLDKWEALAQSIGLTKV